MRKFPPPRSTILQTDFLKPKPKPPKPKIWNGLRQRYRSLRDSDPLADTTTTEIDDDGLCTRCANLDLDAIFAEVMTPVSYWCENVEEIVEIGVLHAGCRLCTIFGHCSDVEVDRSDSWTFGEASYSLLKCSTKSILKDNEISTNVWLPENLLTVCFEWSFEMGARAEDYHQRGFIVQYDPDIDPINSAVKEQEQKVDFQMLSSWLNCCCNVHRSCQETGDWIPASPVFLIDCHERKVDARMPGMRYAALSYVWGKAALEMRPHIELDISITLPSSLPNVIEDAIVATKSLGLRYLWIDRYCIAENDTEIKHKQIASMDEIYSHAEVTLIAVVDHPDEGLPGVNLSPRPQRPFGQFGKYRIASTMRDPIDLINESTWNSRAWTYQEAFLSNRKIIFTKEQAIFECRSMSRYEYLDRPLVDRSRLLEDITILPKWQRNPTYTITEGASLSSLHYRYCKRKMTFQSDAINAFRGIFNHYDKGPSSVKHYWGMPIFPPNSRSNAVKGTDTRETDPALSLTARFVASLADSLDDYVRRRPEFPSWTWAGWHDQPIGTGNIDRETTDIKVWIETADQKLHTLNDFAAADGFNFPHSKLSPYIHLEAVTAPVRIYTFDTNNISSIEAKSHFLRTWLEFDGKEGTRLYANTHGKKIEGNFWYGERPIQQKKYLAIVMGSWRDYEKQRNHVILLIEEHDGFADKVGCVNIKTSLAEKVREVSEWEPVALEMVDGIIQRIDFVDMRKIEWTRRRVRLG